MSDTAHIYNPIDGSLIERVSEYQRIHGHYQSVKSSQDMMDDKEWSGRLGEKQEVDQADQIITSSLNKATRAIKQSELTKVADAGLLKNDELKDLVKLKRQQESQDKRQSGQTSQRKNQR